MNSILMGLRKQVLYRRINLHNVLLKHQTLVIIISTERTRDFTYSKIESSIKGLPCAIKHRNFRMCTKNEGIIATVNLWNV